jgi:predicted phage-related endonuclease
MNGAVVPLFTLGGSEAADACGVGWKSRVRLWAEKTGQVEPQPATDAMLWGTLLEPVVFNYLDSYGPYPVMPAPLDGFRNENGRPWMIGHPDGFAEVDGEAALLEIKTTNQWAAHEWHSEAGAPLAYLLQLHHYFYVTGYEVALLVGLVGGQSLLTRIVRADEGLMSAMLRREDEFVGYLKSGEPPPAERKGDATLLHPDANPRKYVRADAAIEREMREIRIHHEIEKAHKAQRERREERVKAFMGEASILIDRRDNDLATWTPYETSRFDKSALPAELVERHTTKETRRRFTVK